MANNKVFLWRIMNIFYGIVEEGSSISVGWSWGDQ
jgi:hypothetical protein